MYLVVFLLAFLALLTACAAPPPRLPAAVEYRCRLGLGDPCTMAELVAELERARGRSGYPGISTVPGLPYTSTYDLMMAPFPTVIRRAP